jgi:hypothetical protein
MNLCILAKKMYIDDVEIIETLLTGVNLYTPKICSIKKTTETSSSAYLYMKDINKILAKIESYVWEKNCNI